MSTDLGDGLPIDEHALALRDGRIAQLPLRDRYVLVRLHVVRVESIEDDHLVDVRHLRSKVLRQRLAEQLAGQRRTGGVREVRRMVLQRGGRVVRMEEATAGRHCDSASNHVSCRGTADCRDR
jgi:hypothetical protein